MSAKSFANKIIRDSKEYDDEMTELRAQLAAVTAENQKFKDEVLLINYSERLLTATHERDVLKSRCERLEKALGFYADETKYQLKYIPKKQMEMPVVLDSGAIARDALAERGSNE